MSSQVLLRARRDSPKATVTLATEAVMSGLAGTVDHAFDMLESWRLIVIGSEAETTLHALGWRRLLAQPWLTSPLTTYDKDLRTIRTSTGEQYSLGMPGPPDLEPELHAHLVSTLRGWGFKYVRTIALPVEPSVHGRKRAGAETRPPSLAAP